ncbi:hypothetical protein CDD80_4649 [Ophiocordyceps camponoti-rufipedis]|uniref:Uncharacterized protein n=1 Tax=Ophiocordyceps camponoti-rufipedis TaxID=2004952 RepID=A0A2C5XH73_9HYPO|nr:hypothetical protein CDD80_4649 [Ophiocordyceps camponoti-rufipedis]
MVQLCINDSLAHRQPQLALQDNTDSRQMYQRLQSEQLTAVPDKPHGADRSDFIEHPTREAPDSRNSLSVSSASPAEQEPKRSSPRHQPEVCYPHTD